MINQSCEDENYSSGYSTDLFFGTEQITTDFTQSSPNIFGQIRQQPDIIDPLGKYRLENLTKIQLNLIVESVAGTLMELIDRHIQQAFCKQINTLINQVLSIREQVSVFSRQQTYLRDKLDNQIKQQIKILRSNIEAAKNRSTLTSFSSIFRQQTVAHSQRCLSNSQLGRPYTSLFQSSVRIQLVQCQNKIDELRTTMEVNHSELKKKLQEARLRQAGINQSLRINIEEMSQQNATIEHNMRLNVKQNLRELIEDVFICKKGLNQIKQALVRYQEEGVFSYC